MRKYLILVKHSLPEVVENLPGCEWRLSAEGRLRARKLAERLSPYHPEVLVSSIEPKAVQTAEIVAGALGLEFQVGQGLHEHDRSRTPFVSKDDFTKSVQEFFEKPDELVFGSETANQTELRFSQAIDSVLSLHKDRTIAIIAHGTVISLFVARLTGISGFMLWNELGLPSFVLVDVQSRLLIERENIL